MENQFLYTLGNVDAIAKLFMHIRLKGEKETLREVAEQLIARDKDDPNPHAVWYLKNCK